MMAMRNFWIESQVDGRETPLTGGPRSKDGGFNLKVKVRDQGASTLGLDIRGWEENGKLHVGVWDSEGHNVYKKETDR